MELSEVIRIINHQTCCVFFHPARGNPQGVMSWRKLDQEGLVHFNRGEFEKAYRCWSDGVTILEHDSPDSLDLARAYHFLGLASFNQSRFDEARWYYVKALSIRERKAKNSLDLARTYHNLGVACPKPKQKVSYFEQALLIREKKAQNSIELANTYGGLGNAYSDDMRWDKALPCLEKALSIRQRNAPNNSLELASTYNSLGIAYYNQNHLDKAIWSLEKALSIREQKAPNSLELADTYNRLGDACYHQNWRDKALWYYVKALSVREREAPNSLELASTYHNLGLVCVAPCQKENFYLKALSIREPEAPNSLDLSNTYHDLGVACSDPIQKVSYFEKAVSIREQKAPNSLDLASSYHNLGLACVEPSLKICYFEKALLVREQNAPDSLDLASTYCNLGLAHHQNQSSFSEARQYYEMALLIQEQKAPKSLELAFTYYNLGRACTEPSQKVCFYEVAVTIQEEQAPDSLDLANIYYNLGIECAEPSQKISYLEKAVSIQERHAPDSLALASTYHNLGLACLQPSLKLSCYQKALSISEQKAPDSLELANTYHNMGLASVEQSIKLSYFEKALSIHEQKAPETLLLANTYFSLGFAYYNKKSVDEARWYYEKALLIQEQKAPKSLELARTYCSLGLACTESSQKANFYEKALTIQEQLAPESLDLANTYCNISVTCVEPSQKVIYFEKAVSIQLRISADSLDLASAYHNLGLACPEPSEKLTYYKKAASIQKEKAPDSLDLATTYQNIGAVQYSQSNYDDARHYYEMACSIQLQEAPDSPSLCLSYSGIGAVYYKQNCFEDALCFFQMVLSLHEGRAAESLILAYSCYFIGFVLDKTDQASEAQRYYAMACLIRETIAEDSIGWASAYTEWADEMCGIGKYEEASKYYCFALDVYQRQATNHPSIAKIQEKMQTLGIEPTRAKLRSAILANGSAEPVEVSLEYVDLVNTNIELGQGFFGVVFKGYDPDLKANFAIKVVHKHLLQQSSAGRQDIEQARMTFRKEIETLRRFHHPHIAKLYGYHLSDDIYSNVSLIFELAEKGSLDKFWSDDFGRSQLSWKRRLQIALDVATALSYLHNGGDGIQACYHRDIKSANVCLKTNFQAQIIDCGLAKFVTEDDQRPASSATKKAGTPGYICPLYQSNAIPYGPKCEVFSFGVVLMELIIGRLQNFQENSSSKPTNFALHFVMKRQKNRIEEKFDALAGDWEPQVIAELSGLALKCMDVTDDDDRPNMLEVVETLQMLASNFCHPRRLYSSSKNRTDPESTVSHLNAHMVGGICRICLVQSGMCLPCNRFGSPPHLHCKLCLDRHVWNKFGAKEIRCPLENCDSQPFNDEQLCVVDSWPYYITVRNSNETLRAIGANINELQNRMETTHMEQLQVIQKNQTEQRIDTAQNLAALQNTTKNLEDVRSMMISVYARVVERCPRLFVLVEDHKFNPLPIYSKGWTDRMTTVSARLYFVCAHSLDLVEPPIKITITKQWWSKVQPAISSVLRYLNTYGTLISGAAFTLLCGLPLSIPIQVPTMDLQGKDDHLKEFVKKTARVGLPDARDAEELVGRAYELIADKAQEDGNFYDSMSPVFMAGEVQWVLNQYTGLYPKYQE